MNKDNVWICKHCGHDYPGHKRECAANPHKERVVGKHEGCGGNIIEKGQCSWCEKCKQFFCGCACG